MFVYGGGCNGDDDDVNDKKSGFLCVIKKKETF